MNEEVTERPTEHFDLHGRKYRLLVKHVRSENWDGTHDNEDYYTLEVFTYDSKSGQTEWKQIDSW